MKKLNIFLACLFCTITITAQNLYIYKTDGTVYGKQTSTIDSINFAKAQDSFYVHHLDTIKRYAVSEIDSLSFTTPTNTTDTGVVINGVRWATRNVATPGTFAISVEDAGMFYQWNSNVGWPSTGAIGSITATDGSTTWNSSLECGTTATWTSANDPSPTGWRVPTSTEMETLLDTAKVTYTGTIQNGVYGEKFTDKTTGNSIFLPASGSRNYNDGSLGSSVVYGLYWSSTGFIPYHLGFNSRPDVWLDWHTNQCANGESVRPVAK
jgi:uncharacterized protein (TIGR02145 family)